jgi:hypothetical protein
VLRVNVWPVGDRLFGAPSKLAPGARASLAPTKGRPCCQVMYVGCNVEANHTTYKHVAGKVANHTSHRHVAAKVHNHIGHVLRNVCTRKNQKTRSPLVLKP